MQFRASRFVRERATCSTSPRMRREVEQVASPSKISLRRLFQGAAAARALAGGAAEAMTGNPDGIAGDVRVEELGQVHALALAPRQRQVEHLVEVAVVNVAAVVDRYEAAAHHAGEILLAVRLAQQRQIVVELPLGD